HPFLNISYKQNHRGVIVVSEGTKKLVYKDGVAILKNSTCYRMSGYSLSILDLKHGHTGIFTISLGNQLKGLYRNLSYSLTVEGRPAGSSSSMRGIWGLFVSRAGLTYHGQLLLIIEALLQGLRAVCKWPELYCAYRTPAAPQPPLVPCVYFASSHVYT
ncbi:hypothetical protein XENOCAPTIV_005055, partial [Xenoophorus captivus]